MKNLVWLTVALLGQSLSAMAAGKVDVEPCAISPLCQQTFCSGFDTARQVRYTTDVLGSLHFNSLTIKTTDKGAVLNWEVQETTNLQYFLIEHSNNNGQNFLPLFEVPVQLDQKMYSFVDAEFKASDKKVYYRIKAVYPTVVVESSVQKL